jgi:hypothetical protein
MLEPMIIQIILQIVFNFSLTLFQYESHTPILGVKLLLKTPAKRKKNGVRIICGGVI